MFTLKSNGNIVGMDETDHSEYETFAYNCPPNKNKEAYRKRCNLKNYLNQRK
jgi:hypothetical protein